jgi:quercetin dioxygenase-like cupin family protein
MNNPFFFKETPMKILLLAVSGLLLYAVLCINASHAGQWLGPRQGQEHVLRQTDFGQLLAANPLGSGENIKVMELSRNARSSNVLVQVRDREPLHRHADSDITVFLLRGDGGMRIGKEALPVKAGSVIHIPRGAVHAYINRGPEPAAALVVYSPAPGPNDRILVADKP